MLWRSTYETGNEVVDNDHKEIFDMVDRILEGDFTDRPDKIKTSVDFLTTYVGKHFANEENLMNESNYPKTDVHRKQHGDFVKTVGKLMEKIEGNLESIDLSLEINQTIVDWLAEHVMGSDKDLADHYKIWSAGSK